MSEPAAANAADRRAETTLPARGFRTLTARIIVWILPATALVFIAAIGASSVLSRGAAIRAASQEAHGVAAAVRQEVAGVLRSVEESAEMLAASIETFSPDGPRLDALVRRLLTANTHIYGSTVAFEPFAFDPRIERYSPYLYRDHRDPNQFTRADLAAPRYTYWARDWYLSPILSGQPVWSDPYFDEYGGETLMVTYSVPIFRDTGEGRRIYGVVTADVQLGWLSRIVNDIRIGQTGFGVMFSRLGRVIAHPDPSLLNVGVSDQMPQEQRRRLEPLVTLVREGETGFPRLDVEGRRYRAVFMPVQAGRGWTLAALYPEDELMADARWLTAFGVGSALLGLTLLAATIVGLSRSLTAPLQALADRARQLARGDMNLELPAVRSRDEVGTLTAAFHHMRDSLREHIRELRETTAAKERLESELKVAHRIQMDMLPTKRVGGPAEGFEMAAHLVPARSVGGDLYVHLVEEDRAFFMVADVSGKGVAAALFMARTKTLFDALVVHESNPAALLEELNRQLCAANEHGMFVTGVCGVLNPVTGELEIASAGHDPPLRIRPGAPPEPLALEGGPVLGLLEGVTYPLNRARLAPGEGILAFTDGVTDATDVSGVFFGPERLLKAISSASLHDAPALTGRVFETVQQFAIGAPQADDITVMTVRFLGHGAR
jgi:sigma-B regulation protein RsbU (phosphoserine phosphatase)